MENLICNFEILVNRNHRLRRDFVPSNLYVVDDNEGNFHQFKDPSLKPMLRLDIKCYVDMLLNSAQENGYGNIIVDSGYRSYDYQSIVLEELIKEKGDEAYNLVALPGASEHQTGLAFDIAYYQNGIYSDDIKESDNEVVWLMDNSYKYGFILRYPKGKEHITGINFEPWHYRFVGIKLAKYLYDNNLTLEEYYDMKKID